MTQSCTHTHMYQDAQGTKPCKRYGHTANLWNDNCILIFGTYLS